MKSESRPVSCRGRCQHGSLERCASDVAPNGDYTGELVEFEGGSALDHDRHTLTVNSCGKLPCGECTAVTLKVELINGTTYEG